MDNTELPKISQKLFRSYPETVLEHLKETLTREELASFLDFIEHFKQDYKNEESALNALSIFL